MDPPWTTEMEPHRTLSGHRQHRCARLTSNGLSTAEHNTDPRLQQIHPTSCLLFPAVPATSVATSVTTPRSAPPLSVSATTVRPHYTKPGQDCRLHRLLFRQAARPRVKRLPSSPYHRGQAVLPLPRSGPCPGRLPYPPPERRRHQRSLLQLWPARSPCPHLPYSSRCRSRPWWPRWPRWFRRLRTWRFRRRSSPCHLLQVRRPQPLCPRLPGPGHEVLRLRQAWSHLPRLHRSQRRSSQHRRQDLLPVRRGRSHLARLPPEGCQHPRDPRRG
ncbi:hypothetical protein F5X68DRAFT_68773 [Plectosphaerella plurivora]|uniref:Uncharacterized protein n=1 Tax=Plectosphaerella plurivora TaxID=936078 RepID=A0A9P9AEN2_9PEZI|nr:hypothetical protein F5X68DRAFT_68773 [Plectosphaerella plurivora]